MLNYDSIRHVRGESIFLDDYGAPQGTLFGAVFYSPSAHGKIKSLDISGAVKHPGVRAVLTANDIPGENQIGGIIQDEKLLADTEVEFIGEPVAFVVAESFLTARKAAKKIKIEIEKLEVITNPKTACEKGRLIMDPRTYSCGNPEEAWSKCGLVFEGTVESGGQEHLYLETQSSLAIPIEGGSIKIISSTQNPTAIQRTAAKVLGMTDNHFECEAMRLGGGFGGKEDQATAWAVLAALGCKVTGKPVKVVLSRQEDMRLTGKRHPYISDYKIGFSKEGKILAYEVSFYQNAGAAADLSPAILDRTLAHCTGSYFIPNVKATGYSCKTNLPPNTAFRGFGGPQGMFVLEAAIHKAAEKLNVLPYELQEKNLIREGEEFPYGQKTEFCKAEACWNEAKSKFNFESVKIEVDKFNANSKLFKKGFAVMPICFGISFTNTMLNQASSLVHVYADGSVSVSTGAVEMGQGVNMKIRQVAAAIFGISTDRIRSEFTNTTRNANTSATAASSGADMNGNATRIACEEIAERLKKFYISANKLDERTVITFENGFVYTNGKKTDTSWEQIVISAYKSRIDLSSHGFYATPKIHFDPAANKGRPFAYHVYGTAVITATLDCIRGTYEFDSVNIVHDFGKSINPVIDRSQAEGALMQGIGWLTLEEIIFNEQGRLTTDTLSAYKVPDIGFTPKKIEIEFLENKDVNAGVFNSKAIGEPPFMYGIAAYFALVNAVKAANGNREVSINAPMTPEKAFMNIYGEKK
ncbi:MAG: molybdopterin-dependent oxidoreductase [Bacteroidetes bacterium]|nr:molybdopterin-dependent oxidoreductase [Bacteroidota bacterium]